MLASTCRAVNGGAFPTIFLDGAAGGVPIDGQEILEKKEAMTSGNCEMRRGMHMNKYECVLQNKQLLT
ncbi:hypothetical protein ACFX1T_014371 [Malus domestica]